MFELSLVNVKKYMEATLVLEDVSFEVYSGEKVGIVGANGSGKSTILKLIEGRLKLDYCIGYPGARSLGYDEGFINKPREATASYLEQILENYEGLTVLDVLKLAFSKAYKIEEEMRALEKTMKELRGDDLERNLKNYSILLQSYEAEEGYSTEEKLNKICVGLNFSREFLSREFSLLSGGEKTTVILGKILMDNPDILLLDEPTNHLDMYAIEWLENYLKSYKGIVIVVSHDRYFLDNVVTKIIEIEDMKSKTYKGNYSEYLRQREENLLEQVASFNKQQKEMKNLEETIKELRDWAKRADNNKFFKRAKSMEKRLEKMKGSDASLNEPYRGRGDFIRTEKPKLQRRTMNLSFKDGERSGNETIKAISLSKSFEEKMLFKDSNLLVSYGERVALIGGNGSGKTTFLRMLLGEEEKDLGELFLGANVRLGYLPQTICFRNEETTVLEAFRDDIVMTEGKAREYLSRFMFYGNSVFKRVKSLSGGERIRLKLSMLLYEDINLLILDEPTNHLDIEAIETFEEALEEFNGTIFFISHDRYFINKVAERVVAIEDFDFNSYDGDYDYYKEVKERKNVIKENNIKIPKVEKKKRECKREKREKKVDVDRLNKKIEGIEEDIKKIDEEMKAEELGYENLNNLFIKKEELERNLEEALEILINCEED